MARGWIVGFYVPVLGVLLWLAWARLPLTASVLMTVLVVLLSTGLLRLLTTSLSSEGVSQLTYRGPVLLLWRDIRRVSVGHRGVVRLEGVDGTRVRISPIFYNDFDQTLQWLADRLGPVWPADGA
jgi:hypothetical protein